MFEVFIWLAVLIVSIVIEVLTLGLLGIWFAVGALLALIAAALNIPFIICFIIFGIVSGLMIYFTRPVAMKYFNKNRTATNVEAIVGQSAIVTADINNLEAVGEVSVSGVTWTARSTDDNITIKKGEKVIILGVSGVKLFVAKPESIKENVLKKEPFVAEDIVAVEAIETNG